MKIVVFDEVYILFHFNNIRYGSPSMRFDLTHTHTHTHTHTTHTHTHNTERERESERGGGNIILIYVQVGWKITYADAKIRAFRRRVTFVLRRWFRSVDLFILIKVKLFVATPWGQVRIVAVCCTKRDNSAFERAEQSRYLETAVMNWKLHNGKPNDLYFFFFSLSASQPIVGLYSQPFSGL